jgi:putative oxidoreductase
MEAGLLLVRGAIGLLVAAHGAQKVLGWFGGHGVEGTAGFLESIGYRPGRPLALAAGLGELGGGALLALGLVTPLGAAAVVGVMLNAVAVHWRNGPWAANGGWELPFAYGVVAAGVAFTGPGRYSLDGVLDWTLAGGGWGVAATALGIGSALAILALRAGLRSSSGRTQAAGGTA